VLLLLLPKFSFFSTVSSQVLLANEEFSMFENSLPNDSILLEDLPTVIRKSHEFPQVGFESPFNLSYADNPSLACEKEPDQKSIGDCDDIDWKLVLPSTIDERIYGP
jgi:hypothetical protein